MPYDFFFNRLSIRHHAEPVEVAMSGTDTTTTRLSRGRLEYMRQSFAHTNPTIVQLCETALAYMTALEEVKKSLAPLVERKATTEGVRYYSVHPLSPAMFDIIKAQYEQLVALLP